MPEGNITSNIAKKGAERASEQRSPGYIGYVANYYPATFQNKKHAHTADVTIFKGNRTELLEKVPCFVYSSGIIDKGLEINDRVWEQHINGYATLPIITGYYREPTRWDFFQNSIHQAISNVFDEWF